MRITRSLKGAITVEAAIVMPVFICVAVSLAMIIKLIYIHDIMQHAIDEAANDLASYAYIYHVSQLQEIDESMEENLNQNSAQAKRHMDTFMDAYSKLKNAVTEIGTLPENAETGGRDLTNLLEELLEPGTETLEQNGELTAAGVKRVNELQKILEEVRQDPRKELKSIGWLLSKGIYSEAKGIIAVPIVRQMVKGYLPVSNRDAAEKSLEKLNIYKGLEGLDFYSSTIFDGSEDISIVVKYRVQLPMPLKILPDLYLVQQSRARAWLEGGDGTGTGSENIWELPNKERGIKIEALYGGDLPFDFPKIDKYEEATQTGISIKSTNLNSKSYQQNATLKRVLMQYVDALGDADRITYQDKIYPLTNKKMILVIPKGSVKEGNSEVLEYIKSYASSKGVELTISEL